MPRSADAPNPSVAPFDCATYVLPARHTERLAAGVTPIQVVVHLAGGIEVADVESAWAAALARHPGLRFGVSDIGRGFFVPKLDAGIAQIEVGGPADEDPAERLARAFANERRRVFSTATPPCHRLTLLEHGGRSRALVWTAHPCLADRPSWLALMAELLGAPPAPLAPLGSHFERVGRLDREEADAFWGAYLAGLPASAPLDPGTPPICVERSLDPSLAASLELLGVRRDLAPSLVVQAAVGLVLGASRGQDEIVLRTFTDDAPTAFGLVETPVPLRLPIDPDLDLVRWLRRLERRWNAARQWAALAPEGVGSAASVRTVATEPGRHLSEASRARVTGVSAVEPAEAEIDVEVIGGAFDTYRTVWRSGTVDAETLERYAARFERVLRAITHESHGRTVRDLLEAVSESPGAVDGGVVLTAPVEDTVRRGLEQLGHEVALRAPDGVMSGHTLNEAADGVARTLHARNFAPGRIGLLADDRLDTFIALLGALRAGTTIVPLDPTAPPARLRELARRAAVEALFVAPSCLPHAPRGITTLSLDGLTATPGADPPGRAPDDAALVVFTGDEPALVCHGALEARLEAIAHVADIRATERVGTPMPIDGDGVIELVLATWRSGATFVGAQAEPDLLFIPSSAPAPPPGASAPRATMYFGAGCPESSGRMLWGNALTGPCAVVDGTAGPGLVFGVHHPCGGRLPAGAEGRLSAQGDVLAHPMQSDDARFAARGSEPAVFVGRGRLAGDGRTVDVHDAVERDADGRTLDAGVLEAALRKHAGVDDATVRAEGGRLTAFLAGDLGCDRAPVAWPCTVERPDGTTLGLLTRDLGTGGMGVSVGPNMLEAGMPVRVRVQTDTSDTIDACGVVAWSVRDAAGIELDPDRSDRAALRRAVTASARSSGYAVTDCRRGGDRQPIDLAIRARFGDGPWRGARLVDLSRRGACVQLEGGTAGQAAHGSIEFIEPDGDAHWRVELDVVWRRGAFVGVRLHPTPDVALALDARLDMHGHAATARNDETAYQRDRRSLSGLHAALRATLPPRLVPSRYVLLDALPRDAHDRLDLSALPVLETTSPARFVPPRTPRERALCALWGKLLRLRDVGVRDDFFARGGDAELAQQLVTELEEAFGVGLPAAAIRRAPTVAALADLIDEAPDGPEAPIVLRRGGPRPELFLLPDADGAVHRLGPLTERLGYEQPVRAIGPVTGDEPALDSIETFAARRVTALRAQQSTGPYYLAGIGFGGAVAFEMARQLTAASAEIAVLALVDTVLPASGYYEPHWDAAALGRTVRALPSIVPAWLRGERSERRNAMPVDTETSARCIASERMLAAYAPEPWPGDLLLFRAQVRPLLCTHDPALGWRAYVDGAVTVRDIPGTGDRLLSAAGIDAVAAGLEATIDAAMARRRPTVRIDVGAAA